MAGIPRVRVWVAGEVLTAAALNTEFNNAVDNILRVDAAETITSPWTFSSGLTVNNTLTLGSALGITEGGTGATTAAAARTALSIIEADGPGKLSVAGTAPSSPTTNDLWVDTS
jgi:hypothetical protein